MIRKPENQGGRGVNTISIQTKQQLIDPRHLASIQRKKEGEKKKEEEPMHYYQKTELFGP